MPATQLWRGERAPFTLLGGYLGAGKTSIVNHLVRHAGGRRLVVLVNDVGAVNVDAALVAAHDGMTMTLTNGCVCCSIAGDLGQTLEQVRQLPEPPDHVVLELSGVAEPARVAPWAHTPGFRLDGIVVAADAELIASQLARPEVGDTVAAQLAAADLVVLTKTDLVTDGGGSARRSIAEHSSAPIIVAVDGAVEPAVMLGVERRATDPPDVAADARPTDGGYRLATIEVGVVTRAALEGVVADLPVDVLRAKGLVRCDDVDAPVEVNVVGTRRRVRERPDLAVGDADGRIVVIER